MKSIEIAALLVLPSHLLRVLRFNDEPIYDLTLVSLDYEKAIAQPNLQMR